MRCKIHYIPLSSTHTYIYFIVYEILITRELTVFGLDDVVRYCLHRTALCYSVGDPQAVKLCDSNLA